MIQIILISTAIFLSLAIFVLLFFRLPKKARKKHITKKTKNFNNTDYETFIHQISFALHWMSSKKIGALIALEKTEGSLNNYISIGYKISAKLNAEFLIAIFSNKHSSLHDGGIIIRGLEIVSISSYFPIIQSKLITNVGARHRAAAGVTEFTDSISLVVSESTGGISYSEKGILYEINAKDLNSISDELFKVLDFYVRD